MNCPECGRPVQQPGAKLCPHCGYPLLLDKPAVVEQQPHKVTHKPVEQQDNVSYTGQMPFPQQQRAMPPPPMQQRGPYQQQYSPQQQQQPPQMMRGPDRARVLGPHCPQCRHANPPHRKRCEICGTELWPGAAFPPRWMPEPPAVMAGPKRKTNWWKTALLIGLPLLAMGTVWALAYLL
jgi:uncharacterized Zn finger protein (UPF0148 family)